MKPDPAIVRQLVTSERAADLADLMSGDSPYCLALTDNLPPIAADRESEAEVLYAMRMAWEHASFVAKFGPHATRGEKDGHVFAAYPEFFEKWIALGCPGLHQEEVDAYLAARPMS